MRAARTLLEVVLFEPEIPPNTGNVIRLCANAGARLHLVRPLGFRLDERSVRRSALDYRDLAAVEVHADLDACVAALGPARIRAVETAGRTCYADARYEPGDALVFGPETRGLPETVLERFGRAHSLFIPMQDQSRSLNLANAVAVVVYEAWRQLGFTPSPRGPPASSAPRPPRARGGPRA